MNLMIGANNCWHLNYFFFTLSKRKNKNTHHEFSNFFKSINHNETKDVNVDKTVKPIYVGDHGKGRDEEKNASQVIPLGQMFFAETNGGIKEEKRWKRWRVNMKKSKILKDKWRVKMKNSKWRVNEW